MGLVNIIPQKYTCDGQNVNPPLIFSDAPEGTKSLSLIMEDPDVPKALKPDGMWDHWLVWNMPPDTQAIDEGQTPKGIIGKNTGGKNAYQGPCPPDRQHRYFFKLYALDIMLNLNPSETKQELEKAMEGHILTKTQLIGLYNRK